MRRHHGQMGGGLLGFLHAHNCSFYSPLSYSDTTDWISGNQMVKYNSNSAVWDSAINMWKFTYVNGQANSNTAYYAKWTLNTPILQGVPIFTTIGEIYPYDTEQSDIQNGKLCWDFLPNRRGQSFIAITGQYNQCSQIMAVSNGESVQYQYTNGSLSFTYQYGSLLNSAYETEIRIGAPNNSGHRKRYAMRNFALFIGEAFNNSLVNEYFSLL